MQGLLFGMSQPQANEWVHRLTPFLNAALGQNRLRTAQSQERLPHRGMAQGGMNPETVTEKLPGDKSNGFGWVRIALA